MESTNKVTNKRKRLKTPSNRPEKSLLGAPTKILWKYYRKDAAHYKTNIYAANPILHIEQHRFISSHGVEQGSALAPDLFNIFIEKALKTKPTSAEKCHY
jgi:hypothetical protein